MTAERRWNNPDITQAGRVFYQGQWRTPESVERKREQNAESYRRRYANNPDFRERELERCYWNLSGFQYNLKLLRSRRQQGAGRVAARQARREATEQEDVNGGIRNVA